MALSVLVAESVVVLVAGVIAGSLEVFLLDALMLLLTAFLSLSAVSFTIMAMMAFSSLQKQRTGGNAPLAMGLGAVFHNSNFLSGISGIHLGVPRRSVDRQFGRRPIHDFTGPVKQAHQKRKNASLIQGLSR